MLLKNHQNFTCANTVFTKFKCDFCPFQSQASRYIRNHVERDHSTKPKPKNGRKLIKQLDGTLKYYSSGHEPSDTEPEKGHKTSETSDTKSRKPQASVPKRMLRL